MESPFLEIPDEQFSFPENRENEAARDLFDFSFLDGLSDAGKTRVDGEKHIVFTSGGKTFGVPLQDVTEVCRSLPITSLPDVPLWLAGITNLRGDLLAVIDPDVSGEYSRNASSPKTRIIVLTDGQKQSIGLLVDQIKEIALLSAGEVDRSPSDGAGLGSFSCGKTKYRDSALMVIDTKQIFSWPELKNLSEQ